MKRLNKAAGIFLFLAISFLPIQNVSATNHHQDFSIGIASDKETYNLNEIAKFSVEVKKDNKLINLNSIDVEASFPTLQNDIILKENGKGKLSYSPILTGPNQKQTLSVQIFQNNHEKIIANLERAKQILLKELEELKKLRARNPWKWGYFSGLIRILENLLHETEELIEKFSTPLSSASKTITVIIESQQDNTAPVITISGVSEGALYNANVTPVINITDASPFTSTITLNGNAFVSGTEISSDGTYKLFVTAKDSFNNESQKEVNFTVDKTKPVSGNDYGSDGNWVNQDALIHLSATDNLSGVKEIMFKLDSGVFAVYSNSISLSQEGNHTVEYYAVDNAGNIEVSKAISVKIDKTAPVLGQVQDMDIAATGQLTKLDLPLTTVTDNLDPNITYTITGQCADGYPLGTSEVVYQATDHAGNTASMLVKIIVSDKEGPEVTAVYSDNYNPDENQWSQHPVDVTLTAKDNVSSPENIKIYYSFDNATWNQYSGTINVATENESTFYFKAEDEAGLCNGIQSDVIRIDTINPVIHVTKPVSPVLTNNSQIEVAGEIIETNISEAKINGQTILISNNQFNTVFVLQEGANTIAVQAVDKSGRTSNANISNITLDTASPNISITSPNSPTINTLQPAIEFSISDSSGIDWSTLSASVNSVDMTGAIQRIDDSVKLVFNGALKLLEGQNNISLTVRDNAGNQGTLESTLNAVTTGNTARILGRVINAKTDESIADVRIICPSLELETRSSSDGSFDLELPISAEGQLYLMIMKDGYSYVTPLVPVCPGKEFTLPAVRLLTTDPVFTHIEPGQEATVQNSDGSIQLIFPVGAIDNPMDIVLTPVSDDSLMPAVAPEGMGLVQGCFFGPNDAAFNVPVTVKYKNTTGLPPGSQIKHYVWNTSTMTWDDMGPATVSDDGQWWIASTTHFSTGALIDPITPQYENLFQALKMYGITPPTEDPSISQIFLANGIYAHATQIHARISGWSISMFTSKMLKQETPEGICPIQGSSINPVNGILDKEIVLADYNSMSTKQVISLSYNSKSAYPTAEVGIESQASFAQTAVFTGHWQMSGALGSRDAYVKGLPGKYELKQVLPAKDSQGAWLKSGSYQNNITISVDPTLNYAVLDPSSPSGWSESNMQIANKSFPINSNLSGRCIINNNMLSSFGAGWSLSGTAAIVQDSDQYISLLYPNASTGYNLTKTENGVETYSIDTNNFNEDYTTIQHLQDGIYILIGQNGNKVYFNAQGYLTRTENRQGRYVTYQYNGLNQLTTITDCAGLSTTLNYNSRGYIQSVTDPVGRTTQLEVDSNGNFVSMTSIDGRKTNFEYDANHLITKYTPPLNASESGDVSTYYSYDSYGRVTEVRRPNIGITKIHRAQILNDLSSSEGTSYESAATVEPDVKLVVENCCNGEQTEYQIDRINNVLTKNQNGRIIKVFYDDKGQVIKTINTNGSIENLSYDSKGNLVQKSIQSSGNADAQISTVKMEYDVYGNLTKYTDANNSIVLYTYDNSGRLIESTDPRGFKSRIFYENEQFPFLPTKTIRPDNAVTEIIYNSIGNVEKIIAPNNATAQMVYDSKFNLISQIDPLGRQIDFSYNESGMLIQKKQYRINPDTGETEELPISYTYDARDNVTSITDANGKTTQFEYDAGNRLVKTTDATGHSEGTVYSENGLPIMSQDKMMYGTDNYTVYEYDQWNNLKNITFPDGAFTEYQYDDEDNIVRAENESAVITRHFNTFNELTSEQMVFKDSGITQSKTITADTVITKDDTSFDFCNITIDGCTVTIDGTHLFGDLILRNNAVLKQLTDNDPSKTTKMDLTVNTLQIDSTSRIDATGAGYEGGYRSGNINPWGLTINNGIGAVNSQGGSYAGQGGLFSKEGSERTESSKPYGDIIDPMLPGAGGAADINQLNYSPNPLYWASGNGGGVIVIRSAGEIKIDGLICANGGDAKRSNGQGSGGSIDIFASKVSGMGKITADSGNHIADFFVSWSGGGSGGRVSIHCTDIASFNIDNITAFGGWGNNDDPTDNKKIYVGAAGTVYLSNHPDYGQTIIVKNKPLATSNTTPILETIPADRTFTIIIDNALVSMTGTYDIKNLILKNNSTLTHDPCTGTIETKMNITAQTINIDSTSRITTMAKGYRGGKSGKDDLMVPSSKGRTVNNTDGADYYSGGAHGGLGKLSGYTVETGNINTYDDERLPTLPGAGGGATPFTDWIGNTGFEGGGVVYILCETLIANGNIDCSGMGNAQAYTEYNDYGDNILYSKSFDYTNCRPIGEWRTDGGAGAGGSILIRCLKRFEGTGYIGATGGTSTNPGNGRKAGGGRIAVYCPNTGMLFDQAHVVVSRSADLPTEKGTYYFEAISENETLPEAIPITIQQIPGVADPEYTYDLAGNITSIKTPTETYNYAYDPSGNVTAIQLASGKTFSMSYNANDQMVTLNLPEQGSESFTYDVMGIVESISHSVGTFSRNERFERDLTGNITSKTVNNSVTTSISYDMLDQVVQVNSPDLQEDFQYDRNGNRTKYNNSLSRIEDQDRLAEDENYTYEYDLNGRLTKKTEKSSGKSWEFSYNYRNQMVKVIIQTPNSNAKTTAYYKYDAFNRRIEKIIEDQDLLTQLITRAKWERYYYDGLNLILIIDCLENKAKEFSHGTGIDNPIMMKTGTISNIQDLSSIHLQDSYYFSKDSLGSITEVINPSGEVANSYKYSAFGTMYEKTEAIPQPLTYTSREWDEETGLYYYRARYYDSILGRFISQDPIGFQADNNFYRYVNNNPLNYIDPNGENPVIVVILAAWLILDTPAVSWAPEIDNKKCIKLSYWEEHPNQAMVKDAALIAALSGFSRLKYVQKIKKYIRLGNHQIPGMRNEGNVRLISGDWVKKIFGKEHVPLNPKYWRPKYWKSIK